MMERNIENHVQHLEELGVAAKGTLNAMLHALAMYILHAFGKH